MLYNFACVNIHHGNGSINLGLGHKSIISGRLSGQVDTLTTHGIRLLKSVGLSVVVFVVKESVRTLTYTCGCTLVVSNVGLLSCFFYFF